MKQHKQTISVNIFFSRLLRCCPRTGKEGPFVSSRRTFRCGGVLSWVGKMGRISSWCCWCWDDETHWFGGCSGFLVGTWWFSLLWIVMIPHVWCFLICRRCMWGCTVHIISLSFNFVLSLCTNVCSYVWLEILQDLSLYYKAGWSAWSIHPGIPTSVQISQTVHPPSKL